MLPFFHQLEHFVDNARDNAGFRLRPWALLLAAAIILFIAYAWFPVQVKNAFALALFTIPVWLSLILVSVAWRMWVVYIRSKFIASQPAVLLEILPPRNLVKTPLAMEAVLTSLHIVKGESNWFLKYIQGKSRAYWSLEIASLEGHLHLYIWTRAEYRRIIEFAFYSQYPGVQLIEVPDYTRTIDATPEHGKYAIWGTDYRHTNSDPFPIKTYVDFGLDKVQKEPEQVDPLSNLLETLGSIGKGEYMWLQFVIRATGTEKYKGKKNPKTGKQWTWKDEAEVLIQDIRSKTRSVFVDQQGVEQPGFPNPTKGQQEAMAALERNVSKLAYDVGIRSVYVAENNSFNPIMINSMIALFKPFSSEAYNGIKPTRWGVTFSDYPWEINNEKKKDIFREEIVEAYRRRQYYHEPFGFTDYMIMSTEELATLFHIPSASSEAPGLKRISSATGQAPANLPH